MFICFYFLAGQSMVIRGYWLLAHSSNRIMLHQDRSKGWWISPVHIYTNIYIHIVLYYIYIHNMSHTVVIRGYVSLNKRCLPRIPSEHSAAGLPLAVRRDWWTNQTAAHRRSNRTIPPQPARVRKFTRGWNVTSFFAALYRLKLTINQFQLLFRFAS